MSSLSKRLVRALSLAALICAVPALAVQAQETAPAASSQAPSPDTVIATVGGQSITEADLAFAAEDMAQELSQMPPEQQRPFLLRILIDMKVMSSAAREAGMDQTEMFARRKTYLEERALRRAYFSDEIASAVTEESVRAAYDELVAQFQPQPEIRASHILVETEEKAKELKAELDGGADFATLAKDNSIDPGAANGGDLGFFGKGMMVAPFEAAAFALANTGDVSEPVQSQFGWHIIRLEEKRESQPPAFEQVAGRLQQQQLMEAFSSKVEVLMENAQIDITDPELAAAFKAEEEAAAAEEGAAASQ